MIILEQWDYKSFKIFFLDFPIFYSKKHKFYIQENIFKKKKTDDNMAFYPTEKLLLEMCHKTKHATLHKANK